MVDGEVYCWGMDSLGQLGNGTTDDALVPTLVPGITATAVTVGDQHACALAPNGSASCWGNNFSGQLGDGTTVTSPRPVPVGQALIFESIGAGGGHTCGLTVDGFLYCWGFGFFGHLGNGAFENSTIPVRVVDP